MFQFATSCVVFLLQRWQPEICTFLHNLNFSILDWLKWFVVLNWPIFPHNLIVWYKFDCIILANKLCAFQTDFCIIFKWCFVSSESCLRRPPLTPDISNSSRPRPIVTRSVMRLSWSQRAEIIRHYGWDFLRWTVWFVTKSWEVWLGVSRIDSALWLNTDLDICFVSICQF